MAGGDDVDVDVDVSVNDYVHGKISQWYEASILSRVSSPNDCSRLSIDNY